jgi:hypothetical protein
MVLQARSFGRFSFPATKHGEPDAPPPVRRQPRQQSRMQRPVTEKMLANQQE